MIHAVSRWPVAAEDGARLQANTCGVPDGKSGTYRRKKILYSVVSRQAVRATL